MTKCAIRSCRAEFVRRSMTHKCCSPQCAQQYAELQRLKKQERQEQAERKAHKVRKEKLKTRGDYMKLAQAAFNRYIRTRDAGKPCICCGRPLGEGAVGGAFDCGHYRSVGSAPHLRFDERNAHAQRKQCNRWGAGRAVDYRIGLIARIGLEAVEALEADQSSPKWSKEDLIEIAKRYRDKARDLMR